MWYNISTKYLCNDGDLKRRGAPGTREQASRTDVDSKLVRTLICLHARMHGPETKCPFHFEMQAFLHAPPQEPDVPWSFFIDFMIWFYTFIGDHKESFFII